MEILDKVYYSRAIIGIIAGLILGFSLPPTPEQSSTIGIVIIIGIIFYAISYIVAKSIAYTLPKKSSRHIATDGIFPFMFLLLMFMIIVFTGLHQDIAMPK